MQRGKVRSVPMDRATHHVTDGMPSGAAGASAHCATVTMQHVITLGTSSSACQCVTTCIPMAALRPCKVSCQVRRTIICM